MLLFCSSLHTSALAGVTVQLIFTAVYVLHLKADELTMMRAVTKVSYKTVR